MATVTLADLKTRCRERADMVDSDFIEDSELLSYINASYAELYDILVSKFEDYYTLDPVGFTISSGNTYNLPADFYKLRGVDLSLNGRWIPVPKFNFQDRNRTNRTAYKQRYRIIGNKLHISPTDNANGTYQLWYIPAYTLLSLDSDELDGVNGWEEYVVIDVAIKMLAKEESSTTQLEREKDAMLRRITNMAENRDIDQPETVTDVDRPDVDDIFWGN